MKQELSKNTFYSEPQIYSFDAWGRRRNPANWSDYSVPASFLFVRGFTGHEHLDEFELINMNGRVYDPVIARFLSPDPFIQAPDNTQSFNRYSYCVNNPLVYTDPSGEIFGTIFTARYDFYTTIFAKGGLEFWNWNGGDSYVGRAWRNFDPTAPWSKTNKAAKIDIGLFVTDNNKNFVGRVWELVSRFTWQLPQTVVGNFVGHSLNLANEVNSVEYYGGATILDVNNLPFGRGVAHGSYIFGEDISYDPFDINDNGELSAGARLLRHEYGHYIQSQKSGWLYYGKYGIPSARGNENTWTEIDAEYCSDRYFTRHYGNESFYIANSKGTIKYVNTVGSLFIQFNNTRYRPDYRAVKPRLWEY